MALDPIRPKDLPPATAVTATGTMIPGDNGTAVQRVTPAQIVAAVAPVASEAVAIAGIDNISRMTALTTRQVLDNEAAPSVLLAQAWAESVTAPNPLDPTSKSSKTWAAQAAVSATSAALYDGIWFDDLPDVTADTVLSYTAGAGETVVAPGDYVKTRSGISYTVAASGATDNQTITAAGVKLYLVGPWSSSAFSSSAAFAAAVAAYAPTLVADKTRLTVKSGETVAIPCNPTSGHDLQAYAGYMTAGHTVQEGGILYLQIADGLHDVSTYIDITDGRYLDMRSATVPDQLIVNSATFSATTGATTATIIVDASTPLPARVVAGFAVGGLNIQGDGGADLLNGGMIVASRDSGTQFTALLRSNGVALAAFTTPDNTASLGLTPNRLLVPYCTIRAAEAGWDGAAREGFMNALRGGNIDLTYIGLSYNGVAGENDMLFAQGAGSEIRLRDYCVIAGSGEMNARSHDRGHIYANRSCVGGGQTGVNIWQGSNGGTATFIRTMMGSVSGDAISTSSDATASMGLCVVTGANIGLRTTYESSNVTATGTRVSRANLACAPAKGNITIDSASSIKNCTTPISITGSNGGKAHGNPTISGNTNAVVASFAVQSTGGVWIPTALKTYDKSLQSIGRFTGALDFPSIAAGTFADLTIASAGAAFGDFVQFARAGGAIPAQGVVFMPFVSAADVVTVRAFNITGSAIDPTSFTGAVLVVRSA